MKKQTKQNKNKSTEPLSQNPKKSKTKHTTELISQQTVKQSSQISLANQQNTYEQFMQLFKQKKEYPQFTQGKTKKVKINEPSEIIISPYKKIQFVSRGNTDSQMNYFSYDLTNFNNLKEIYYVQFNQLHFYIFIQKQGSEHKEQGPTYEELILNNQVNLQDFRIKKEYKERKELYSSNSIETILLDKLSEKSIQTNGILANPKLELTIQEYQNMHKLNNLGNELFLMMSDLYDLFYIDQKEKLKESFIDIIVCHILNHLNRSNLIKEKLEEEEEIQILEVEKLGEQKKEEEKLEEEEEKEKVNGKEGIKQKEKEKEKKIQKDEQDSEENDEKTKVN